MSPVLAKVQKMKEDSIYFINDSNKMELAFNQNNESLKDTPVDRESEQSAINEETGEINWDCPCLASALAPPCGEFFKEAFSCFVASKAEPKGSDCLKAFSAMQECFRAHPDIYMKPDDEDEPEVTPQI